MQWTIIVVWCLVVIITLEVSYSATCTRSVVGSAVRETETETETTSLDDVFQVTFDPTASWNSQCGSFSPLPLDTALGHVQSNYALCSANGPTQGCRTRYRSWRSYRLFSLLMRWLWFAHRCFCYAPFYAVRVFVRHRSALAATRPILVNAARFCVLIFERTTSVRPCCTEIRTFIQNGCHCH